MKWLLGGPEGEIYNDISPQILVAHPKLLNKIPWPITEYWKCFMTQAILINKFAISPKDDFQFKNE